MPKGLYEVSFFEQDGSTFIDYEPSEVDIKLGDAPQCAYHLVDSDINIRTKAPTTSPTTTPLTEPLYSDAILSPLDPVVKLGSQDWTSDPEKVISGIIQTYSLYLDDDLGPAFSVAPRTQHTCSIVQSMLVYTSPSSNGKDPNSYKLEGRYGIHDDWNVMSEGFLGKLFRLTANRYWRWR